MTDQTEEKTLLSAHQSQIGFSLLLLIWLAQMLIESRQWPTTEDKLFPLVIGIPTAALLVITIILFSRRDSIESDTSERSNGGPQPTTLIQLKLVILIASFVGLIYLAGVVIALPVFIISSIYYLTRDIRRSTIVSILVLLLIYLLFVQILDMVIYEGVLGIGLPF